MRKRQQRIVIHLSSAELEQLNRNVMRSGLTREGFVRSTLSGFVIRERPPMEWPEILRQLSGIGTNINQIAHIANGTGRVQAQSIADIQRMQSEIWSKVKGL